MQPPARNWCSRSSARRSQTARWCSATAIVDSSLAYQGYGRDLGFADILALNVWATECLLPDLTLFLDLDDSVRSGRLAAVPDRLEAEDEEFHRRVAEGFQGLAGGASSSNRRVDARGARSRCRSGCGPWSKRNWSSSVTDRPRPQSLDPRCQSVAERRGLLLRSKRGVPRKRSAQARALSVPCCQR